MILTVLGVLGLTYACRSTIGAVPLSGLGMAAVLVVWAVSIYFVLFYLAFSVGARHIDWYINIRQLKGIELEPHEYHLLLSPWVSTNTLHDHFAEGTPYLGKTGSFLERQDGTTVPFKGALTVGIPAELRLRKP